MKNLVYGLSIEIKTQFAAQHRYLDAPEHVKFLRDWHRHVFHVEVELPVDHEHRSLEFFTVKAFLNNYLYATFEGKQFELSCEAIALDIAMFLKQAYTDVSVIRVKVSEDGENSGLALLYEDGE